MKTLVKKIVWFYWHHGQAYSLLTLPLNGLGALSAFLLALSQLIHLTFSKGVYITIYLVSIPVLFLIALLFKAWGILSYYQSLGNSQNPELLEIKETVKRIESKL